MSLFERFCSVCLNGTQDLLLAGQGQQQIKIEDLQTDLGTSTGHHFSGGTLFNPRRVKGNKMANLSIGQYVVFGEQHVCI